MDIKALSPPTKRENSHSQFKIWNKNISYSLHLSQSSPFESLYFIFLMQ
jgi:hypothetical protein